MARYRKPQPQTLSIRISDETRNRLERARELVGGKQSSVSTSEVAKLYLESMPDDHAALEAAHLLTQPTQSLLMIRRKWQYWEHLSRAEWNVIGYYVQHGAEDQSKNPVLPSCDAIADLLQAFLALRNLRTDARPDLDAYYTSKLLDSELRVPSKAHGDTLAHTVRQVIDELRTGSSTARPAFAGRIFRIALRDEPLTSTQAASQALAPFWAALSRLAARGHWLREHRPLHDPSNPHNHSSQLSPPVFPFVAGDYQLTVLTADGNDLTSAINMKPQRVVYPLNTYPEISEFAAMAGQLKGGQTWSGKYFFGYTCEPEKAALQFAFRSRQNGITIDFSVAEWTSIRQLFATLFQKPELRPIFDALTLAYGEI